MVVAKSSFLASIFKEQGQDKTPHPALLHFPVLCVGRTLQIKKTLLLMFNLSFIGYKFDEGHYFSTSTCFPHWFIICHCYILNQHALCFWQTACLSIDLQYKSRCIKFCSKKTNWTAYHKKTFKFSKKSLMFMLMLTITK